MLPSELLGLFRREMSDVEAPYLWSDEDVYGYLDDAQRMYCRRTDGIADASTASVVEIVVAANDDWVSTHPSIRRIRSASRADTGRPIEILNRDDLIARRWYLDGSTGPLKALVLGSEAHKARTYPRPNEGLTVLLEVFRLPLEPITDADPPFEVAEEHHPHLLMWVKHRAYMKQDAETFDRSKAEEFEQSFYAYCERARQEERRKAFKVRTVAYGGI